MLCLFALQANLRKYSKHCLGQFTTRFSPFRAINYWISKGRRRQTRTLQSVTAHTKRHRAQCVSATLTSNLALDSASQSLISFDGQNAPHFRERRFFFFGGVFFFF